MPKWNTLTNKQGLIVWGGEQSTDYGIVVSAAPAFDKPRKRTTVYNIPGRNGDIITQDGSFDNVVRTYKVWLAEDEHYDSGGYYTYGSLAERVNAFSEWLYSKTGYQKLSDNFEPDYFRLAYFAGGQEITDELLMYGETELSFVCKPQRFLTAYDSASVTTKKNITFINPTKYNSKPLIKLEGSGTCSIGANGNTITVTGLVDYIYIDCDTMNAYRLASENKNSDISGAFPVLASGVNAIATTGTITTLKITPRYFKL